MIFLKKLLPVICCILICAVLSGAAADFKKTYTSLSVNSHGSSLPTIIVDAGHGGFDGGALTNDGTPEKDINLKISLYLKEYLDTFGFDCILTRDSDASLEDDGLNTIRQKKTSDIHNRMKITEDNPDSIFISIHQNRYHDDKYSGMQVFYSGNFSEISAAIAQSIQDSTVSLIQNDNTRLIKKCGTSVYLIYNAKVPSCLVECGFLSNTNEAALLQKDSYQKKIAYAIAVGILDYYSD